MSETKNRYGSFLRLCTSYEARHYKNTYQVENILGSTRDTKYTEKLAKASNIPFLKWFLPVHLNILLLNLQKLYLMYVVLACYKCQKVHLQYTLTWKNTEMKYNLYDNNYSLDFCKQFAG